jgi:hypothetical protein
MIEHCLTYTYRTEADCGAHMCRGHVYYTLHCSCGFETSVGDGSLQTVGAAIKIHRQKMVEEALGLHFTINSITTAVKEIPR